MTTETMPAEGQQAPAFELPSTEGRPINLRQFAGQRNVVLYFYPKDDTPGCTKEACSFRDLSAEFAAHDAVILGVSADSVESHHAFRSKFGLPFPLLADEGGQVARQYGSWREGTDGKPGGVVRNTFVIDKAGVVRRVYEKVNAAEHAPEVLRFIDSTLGS